MKKKIKSKSARLDNLAVNPNQVRKDARKLLIGASVVAVLIYAAAMKAQMDGDRGLEWGRKHRAGAQDERSLAGIMKKIPQGPGAGNNALKMLNEAEQERFRQAHFDPRAQADPDRILPSTLAKPQPIRKK